MTVALKIYISSILVELAPRTQGLAPVSLVLLQEIMSGGSD